MCASQHMLVSLRTAFSADVCCVNVMEFGTKYKQRVFLQIFLTLFLVKWGETCQYQEYNYRLTSTANRNTYLDVKYQFPEAGPLLTSYRGNEVKVGQ